MRFGMVNEEWNRPKRGVSCTVLCRQNSFVNTWQRRCLFPRDWWCVFWSHGLSGICHRRKDRWLQNGGLTKAVWLAVLRNPLQLVDILLLVMGCFLCLMFFLISVRKRRKTVSCNSESLKSVVQSVSCVLWHRLQYSTGAQFPISNFDALVTAKHGLPKVTAAGCAGGYYRICSRVAPRCYCRCEKLERGKGHPGEMSWKTTESTMTHVNRIDR